MDGLTANTAEMRKTVHQISLGSIPLNEYLSRYTASHGEVGNGIVSDVSGMEGGNISHKRVSWKIFSQHDTSMRLSILLLYHGRRQDELKEKDPRG